MGLNSSKVVKLVLLSYLLRVLSLLYLFAPLFENPLKHAIFAA